MSLPAPDVFDPAKESINWAKEAIVELNEIRRDFFARRATELVTESDAQTGERVWKVRLTERFPKAFGRRATEALIHTRHSFDQSVYAACSLFTATGNKSINFPWASSPTDLHRLLEKRGIPAELWDTIGKHEPYPRSESYAGGDDTVRTLATIANNKHTVGIAIIGHVSSVTGPDIRGSVSSMSIRPHIWDPVKNEVELVRYRGDAEVSGNCILTFHVALQDARLPFPLDAADSLTLFVNKGEAVLESLEARCRELGCL